MMRHESNSMKQTTPNLDKVWNVDSGASNHMTSHKEWFAYLEKPMQPGVVATGDDTECWRSSPGPCRAERETHERTTCSNNHEELGVSRTDH